MALWLTEKKTISQQGRKSSSSSETETESTKSADSFYLEPDIVLGNIGKFYFPDDEIATNYLSLMAGHIMKSMESSDYMRRIEINPPATNIKYLHHSDSGKSVLDEKCLKKKKKTGLMRKSRMYNSISTTKSSIQSFRVPKSFLFEPRSLVGDSDVALAVTAPTRTESEVEPIEEFEGDRISIKEEDGLLRELSLYPASSYLGTLYINKKLLNWTYKERDQKVEILFKSGDRYMGRISRMVMEGEGKYIWSDGTIYEGSFKEGTAHGKGSILWPNGSWYEGDMRCNLREGHGITHRVTTHGEMYHYGLYRAGRKHGKGVLVYGENNWYDGDWKFGKRFGFGTRLYRSGALYCGQWNNGLRSGQGTMIWANNDVCDELWW